MFNNFNSLRAHLCPHYHWRIDVLHDNGHDTARSIKYTRVIIQWCVLQLVFGLPLPRFWCCCRHHALDGSYGLTECVRDDQNAAVASKSLFHFTSLKTASHDCHANLDVGYHLRSTSCRAESSRSLRAKGDKRLAHDIMWDSSNNDKGQNGWCIPDRVALNDAVNAWRKPVDELSYASLLVLSLKEAESHWPSLATP
jgi:hypothetical protein